jgi:outer membrane lipoprotein SlyB
VVRRYATAAALLALAVLPEVLAQPAGTSPVPDGGASVVMRCRECGVINSVREIQQARDGVTPGHGADAPIGLVIYIPVGAGSSRSDSFAGSGGNREWQTRINTTRYEFTVRMDDGDYRLVQKNGVSDLRVGDRVKLDGPRIERWGS